jgi:hypothetical protein
LLDALSDAGTALVGLFDFDGEGYPQWKGTIAAADAEPIEFSTHECQPRKRRGAPIWVALLPVPEFRKSYASLALAGESRLTIELLFPDCFVKPFLERIPVAGDESLKGLPQGQTRKSRRSPLPPQICPPKRSQPFNLFSIF